jgi:hypothetical protein
MVGCDFLQRDFSSRAFFLRPLAAPCKWTTLDRFRDHVDDVGFILTNRTTRMATRSAQCWMHESLPVRISLVDILSSGFGDANVATQHKQSNRGNRCRQSKDKPHRPGMSRTVFWTKRR